MDKKDVERTERNMCKKICNENQVLTKIEPQEMVSLTVKLHWSNVDISLYESKEDGIKSKLNSVLLDSYMKCKLHEILVGSL